MAAKQVDPNLKSITTAIKYLKAADREVARVYSANSIFDIDYHQATDHINNALRYLESIRVGIKENKTDD